MTINQTIEEFQSLDLRSIRLRAADVKTHKRLVLAASIDTYTGYGLLGIQFTRGLEQLTGMHVAVRALDVQEPFGSAVPADIKKRFVQGLQPEAWEFVVLPPGYIPHTAKRTVYFTMWEASRIAAEHAAMLNKTEAVIVPNIWNATCFSAGGVDVPIRTVPLGINTGTFRLWPRRVDKDEKLFIFGTAGRMAHGGVRKGINDVIDIFLRAFPTETDVRLHVKCHPDCPVSQIEDERIIITAAHLTELELARWYANLDCFVSAARAEGWGLMQLQAMAVGRALMSINFGGVAEYFESAAGYEVDYELKHATEFYSGHGVWAEPQSKSFIDLMRLAYENPDDCVRRGARAAESVKKYSLEASNKQLAEALKEIGMI